MKKEEIRPRSKYVISGYTLLNMVDLAVRLGRIDEKWNPEDVSDDVFNRSIRDAIKTGKDDYFKLLKK